MEKKLDLSVHQLVDFLLRKGDIDSRIYNKTSMSEGTRLHASYQRRQSNEYIAEYFLTHTFEVDGFSVTLSGRADGIIERPFFAIIDEIKTSVIDNEEFFNSQKEWHLGQAKVYALIYALDNDYKNMGVRLTYINQLNDKQLIKEFKYSVEELNGYVISLIKEYLDFYQTIFRLKEERNITARTLEFPFSNFRKGQRELAKYTYSTLNKGEILFVEAPTGIGKTMSTLYPAIKTFANEENDKIFYLTAKNSGIESSFSAAKLLLNKGLKAKIIQITAKEKICACVGRNCNPDDCPYAKGYYEKLRKALTDALNSEIPYSKNEVLNIALDHALCPFEFQLDLSLFCDVVICDFNYLFDPLVYLKRYFDNQTKNIVGLIDEAHNLVERGRDMYTTELNYDNFKKAKKALGRYEHKKLKSSINKLQKLFKEYEMDSNDGYNLNEDLDVELVNALSNFQKAATDYMKKVPLETKQEFTDFFFEAIRFIKISDFFNETFRMLTVKDDKHLIITIINLDPSKLLKDSLDLLRGAVLFSATLSPLDYYVRMLGGNDKSPVLKIPSPFERDNLLLMIAPSVATTYKKRNETIGEVANYIKTMIDAKKGNYFVFFPSYKYLNNVLKCFDNVNYDIHVQTSEMSEIEKAQFLDNFKPNPTSTHVAFVVLGGIFSEGIDLLNDRLIGAVIVGVGLPQISFERDLIKDYFNSEEENGFEFAYVKPGMNRVIQAVGRVIRSENDVGAVLLIDNRYLESRYRDLFKSEWDNYKVVLNTTDVQESLKRFYERKNYK